jgi:hypothetical protein
MADTRSLRLIGLYYGVVTAVIALIAILVVTSHVLGYASLDDGRQAVEITAARR